MVSDASLFEQALITQGDMMADSIGQPEAESRRQRRINRRRRRILTLVQDALGQLRLDMKYLMFDLEATRRERDEYRRQSEES